MGRSPTARHRRTAGSCRAVRRRHRDVSATGAFTNQAGGLVDVQSGSTGNINGARMEQSRDDPSDQRHAEPGRNVSTASVGTITRSGTSVVRLTGTVDNTGCEQLAGADRSAATGGRHDQFGQSDGQRRVGFAAHEHRRHVERGGGGPGRGGSVGVRRPLEPASQRGYTDDICGGHGVDVGDQTPD